MLPSSLRPISFQRFFESSRDLAASPFLRPRSARYLSNLSLKVAIFSALLLAGAAACAAADRWPLAYMLITAIYFATGTPALIESLADLAQLNFEIDILMTAAAFASAATGHALEGALLLVLFALSRAMETAVTARARSSLSNLRHLAPKKALVRATGENWVTRHVRDVCVGDVILIRAGEIVPLDGRVCHGTSSVAISHLTGESRQIPKSVGDLIDSGSQNGEGALQLEVKRTSGDSTLHRLIQLVTSAQEAKPRLQHAFERFESLYAKSIFAMALALALIPPAVGLLSSAQAIYRATCFLIAASPCALILALPIAYLSCIGACARRGVVLKGGTALDALNRCRALAFDKTGTLTLDQLTVQSAKAWRRQGERWVPCEHGELPSEFLAAIAAAEMNVVHPVATALADWCQKSSSRSLPDVLLAQFSAHPGKGVEAQTDRGPLRVGQLAWAAESAPLPIRSEMMAAAESSRAFIVSAACEKDWALLFQIGERLRGDVAEVLKDLKNRGLTLSMLTGDSWGNAREVGRKLGIDEIYAELTPQKKLELVEQLDAEFSVAMIGDGINDAPALARATVGIAMGGAGSALAAQAADIVLLNDDLQLLVWVAAKARKTRRIVAQNLALALGAIAIGATASCLGYIPLAVAVCAHEGGTVLVGLNGLRLLRE